MATTYPGWLFDITSSTSCYKPKTWGDPMRCFVDATLAKDESTSFLVTVKLDVQKLPGVSACTVYTVSHIVDPAGASLQNKDPGNDEQSRHGHHASVPVRGHPDRQGSHLRGTPGRPGP
ncbi:MAG: hypothetical protein WDM84_05925 [Bauldia sp.]